MRRAFLTLRLATSLSIFGCGDSSSNEPAAAGGSATGEVSGICEVEAALSSIPPIPGEMCFSFSGASDEWVTKSFNSTLCRTYSGKYIEGGSCSSEAVFDDTCTLTTGTGIVIKGVFYNGFNTKLATNYY